MRARPISPDSLVDDLTERVAASPRDRWTRVAVDGSPAAHPGELADALVEPLRGLGRAVLRASAWDFLRPASLRYEFGRYDPEVFYDHWLDVGGLTREVLGPLGPTGSGKVLPSLWDRVADRATRARYVTLPPGGVLLLDGALLLGRGLPLDLTVHLHLSAAALARRTPADEAWTLPAYARYDERVRPLRHADVAVRMDDPRHPALVLSSD
jgi:hypothetical protein